MAGIRPDKCGDSARTLISGLKSLRHCHKPIGRSHNVDTREIAEQPRCLIDRLLKHFRRRHNRRIDFDRRAFMSLGVIDKRIYPSATHIYGQRATRRQVIGCFFRCHFTKLIIFAMPCSNRRLFFQFAASNTPQLQYACIKLVFKKNTDKFLTKEIERDGITIFS